MWYARSLCWRNFISEVPVIVAFCFNNTPILPGQVFGNAELFRYSTSGKCVELNFKGGGWHFIAIDTGYRVT